MFHVESVTFSDANFSQIPIVMTMKLCLFDIHVEGHKILKGSHSEINIFKILLHELSRLQTLQKFTFLFLTEIFYGAKHWSSLECKLYFLITIIFDEIMEMNFT